MGSAQSTAMLSRGFSPYATESPTRDFLGGSILLGPTPTSYWSELFQEFYLLKSSPKVPKNLQRSLDTATRALTRTLARPDHVDAHNVSTLFRVAVSFMEKFVENDGGKQETSAPSDDDVAEVQICGAVGLLAVITDAFISSGAGRDRIYLVLGASGRRERVSDLLSYGESIACSTVEALCACLVSLGPQMSRLKHLIINCLINILSARLYADRSLPRESVAFLPFFERWGMRSSNAHELVSTLVEAAVIELQKESEAACQTPTQFSPRPEEFTRTEVDYSVAEHISPMAVGASELFGRLRRASSRSGISSSPASSAGDRNSPALDPTSPFERSNGSSSPFVGIHPGIILLLILLYGSDLKGAEPFLDALIDIVELPKDDSAGPSTPSSPKLGSYELTADMLLSVCLRWVDDDNGILLFYALIVHSESFRRLSMQVVTNGEEESPLFDLLYRIVTLRESEGSTEMSFLPHVVLEILVEDSKFCEQLERETVPVNSLSEILGICSLEEARTLCISAGPNGRVRLTTVILLVALHSASRRRSDNFLLTMSVSILANISTHTSRIVNHAAWSLVTVLDSVSSRYRSYISEDLDAGSISNEESIAEDQSYSRGGSNVTTRSSYRSTGVSHLPDSLEDGDDVEELSQILGIMVEAVAACIIGFRQDGQPYVRNGHILFALWRTRESIFDSDSGVTLMIMKNREATPQCRVACSRLNNLIGQVASPFSENPHALGNDQLMESIISRIEYLPLNGEGGKPGMPPQPSRFHYLEEDSSHDFFAPLVWSIARGFDLDDVNTSMRFLRIPEPSSIRQSATSSL